MPFENPFKHLTKPQIYISVGGAVAIGGYFVVEHYKATRTWNPWAAGSAAAANTTANGAAAGSGTDPVTGMPYYDDDATDPLTNQTSLAEATQSGSVAAARGA